LYDETLLLYVWVVMDRIQILIPARSHLENTQIIQCFQQFHHLHSLCNLTWRKYKFINNLCFFYFYKTDLVKYEFVLFLFNVK